MKYIATDGVEYNYDRINKKYIGTDGTEYTEKEWTNHEYPGSQGFECNDGRDFYKIAVEDGVARYECNDGNHFNVYKDEDGFLRAKFKDGVDVCSEYMEKTIDRTTGDITVENCAKSEPIKYKIYGNSVQDIPTENLFDISKLSNRSLGGLIVDYGNETFSIHHDRQNNTYPNPGDKYTRGSGNSQGHQTLAHLLPNIDITKNVICSFDVVSDKGTPVKDINRILGLSIDTEAYGNASVSGRSGVPVEWHAGEVVNIAQLKPEGVLDKDWTASKISLFWKLTGEVTEEGGIKSDETITISNFKVTYAPSDIQSVGDEVVAGDPDYAEHAGEYRIPISNPNSAVATIYLNEPLRRITYNGTEIAADYVDWEKQAVIRNIYLLDNNKIQNIAWLSSESVRLSGCIRQNFNTRNRSTIPLKKIGAAHSVLSNIFQTTDYQNWNNDSLSQGIFTRSDDYSDQGSYIFISLNAQILDSEAGRSYGEKFTSWIKKQDIQIFYQVEDPITEQITLPDLFIDGTKKIKSVTTVPNSGIELTYCQIP